jgi:hypothetical protein
MDNLPTNSPLPSPPADAQALQAQRLAHIFRHASAPGQPPHPLLRLVQLYRAAQAQQELPHG